jgi:peptidoglycan/LPS O-acetylase OafA/YrhL
VPPRLVNNDLPPESDTVRSGRYYRPELDLLRFAAFFLVFLSHVVPGEADFYARAHLPPALGELIVAVAAGGAFGVDLFFVLSAFLITTLLIRERRECGHVDIKAFYIRRVLRIWPLYFAFLLVIAPLVRQLLPDDVMPAKYTLAFAALAGNWACVVWGYPHSVASPLWSVSIEEQFYLTWPVVVSRWAERLVAVAIGLWIVSVISRFALVAVGAVHPQIWCNTVARFDPIACGAILAVVADRRRIELSVYSRLALLLTGMAVLTAAGRYGDFVGARALMTFPAVTAACAALFLATFGLSLSWQGRVVRGWGYLGRISYGLYIFHPMFIGLFGVTTAHEPAERLARVLGALVATTIAAAGSYRFFEGPFLRLKDRFRPVVS